METVWRRHAFHAEGVRKAVAAWDGCELVARGPDWASDTVSAIYTPEGVDAREVISGAYNRYQTSLGTGLNKLMGKAFRIGHLGSLNPVMLCGAISAAEMALRDAGARIEPGSGVAAAQERKQDATGFWRPALDRLEARPPPDHPDIGRARNDLNQFLSSKPNT